jgi:Na+-translocating ferredoxin:NAD+ oxidoreductase RNF subunit RnfB
MNISRKEFLTRGIWTFGRDVMTAVFSSRDGASASSAGEPQGKLLYFRERCLAQQGGCFACIDHCPQEAIGIRPGVGIQISGELCNGCAECLDFCPVTPRAIMLNDQ